MAHTLVEFVRSIQTNLDNGVIVPINATSKLILEFGVNVPTATNFIELITTVGWQATNVFVTPPEQPKLLLQIVLDGVVVSSAEQKSISTDEDGMLEMTTAFHSILTNVSVGFHVIQVFASNPEDLQGDITLTGPVSITGKVYAPA
ncbi:hypothetical protein PAECIP111892_02100 [Paenibacillus auburnensis]|jgi:hypothetical protein|uniref:Uncharacterized protein n=1 Tax=Paenibacillus auburnensis TaxID=2905649 RepID=A0ABN8G4Y3_9BACL|nr:hypothetical protein [Paenibacillus auburnensis]CAH1195764.1 hypothetical protein PAECIP111892_02100 [Paenibacillus auburnensis]